MIVVSDVLLIVLYGVILTGAINRVAPVATARVVVVLHRRRRVSGFLQKVKKNVVDCLIIMHHLLERYQCFKKVCTDKFVMFLFVGAAYGEMAKRSTENFQRKN